MLKSRDGIQFRESNKLGHMGNGQISNSKVLN